MTGCSCNKCDLLSYDCACNPWTHVYNDSSNNGTWWHYSKYDLMSCYASSAINYDSADMSELINWEHWSSNGALDWRCVDTLDGNITKNSTLHLTDRYINKTVHAWAFDATVAQH